MGLGSVGVQLYTTFEVVILVYTPTSVHIFSNILDFLIFGNEMEVKWPYWHIPEVKRLID